MKNNTFLEKNKVLGKNEKMLVKCIYQVEGFLKNGCLFYF